MPLDVDPAPVRGVWFRHVPAGDKPLHRPSHPADGRWQHGETVEGFYLADSEETAWAEWYGALAELGLPPMRQLPRDLWRFEIDIDRVADLSAPERLQRVRLDTPVADRRQWPAFQAVERHCSPRAGRECSTRLRLDPSRSHSASSAGATAFPEFGRYPRRSATTSLRRRPAASASSSRSAVAG